MIYFLYRCGACRLPRFLCQLRARWRIYRATGHLRIW
jgi:hypothetical protein